MIITDIAQQKKNEKRYSIFIDGQFVFGLSDVDVLFFRLKIGEEISEKKLNNIIETSIKTKARETVFNYIGYRARTEKEVRKKLEEKEFSMEIIDEAIEFVKGYGYINDEQYAKDYIEEKLNYKGWGISRIKHELSMKGVEREIISLILEENDFTGNEIKKACEVLTSKIKYKDVDDLDQKEKKKLYDFLLRRGYSYSVAKEAFKIVIENIDEDY